MMKSIFRKEVSDLLPWVPIAIILLSFLCFFAAPRQLYRQQSVEQTILMIVGFGCALVAMTFGFRQSLSDTRPEARGYLIHRPLSTAKIFWAKLAAGFVVYTFCLAIALLGLSVYLESKGPLELPTSGMQVLPLMVVAIAIFSLHPAAMWTANRDAKWLGSKSFPLLFAAAGIFVTGLCLQMPTGHLGWFGLAMVTTLGVTLRAALHAFCHSQFSPSANTEHRTSFFDSFAMLVVSVILCTTLVITIASWLEANPEHPITFYKIAVTDKGELWEVAETVMTPVYSDPLSYKLAGRPIQTSNVVETEFQKLPDDWREISSARFSIHPQSRRASGLPWPPVFRADRTLPGWTFTGRGRLYLYGQNGLKSVVTPRGVYSPDEIPVGRFEKPAAVSSYSVLSSTTATRKLNVQVFGVGMMFDANGVYQVNGTRVQKIVDDEIDQAHLILQREHEDAVLWTIAGDSLKKYTIASHTGNPLKPAPDNVSDSDVSTSLYFLPVVTATLAAEWDVQPNLEAEKYETLAVTETKDGVTAMVLGDTSYTIYGANQSIRDQGSISLQQTNLGASTIPRVAALIPPAAFLVGYVTHFATFLRAEPVSFFAFCVAHALLSAAIAFWLGGRRELPLKTKLTWTVIGALAGAAGPLAMLAIYPRLVREPCPQCEAARRVDADRCKKCGAEWEPPALDGTEIVGPQLSVPELSRTSQ